MIPKLRFLRCISLLVGVLILSTGLYGQMNDDTIERNLNLARKYYTEENFRLALHYAKLVTSMSPGNLEALELIHKSQAPLSAETVSHIPSTSTVSNGSNQEEALLAKWRNLDEDSEERTKAGADLSAMYLEKAQALGKSKEDVAQAMLYLRKAAILNSENGWVQYEMFKILSEAGRIEESLAYGRRFLTLVGFGVVATDVKRKLVGMLLATGDKYSAISCWDTAAKFYREVEKCEPSDEEREESFQKLVIALKTLFFQLHGKEMYVEAVPYLDQLYELRPGEETARAEFDRKHFWRIKRFAPDVYWLAAEKLKKREEFAAAMKCIENLLSSGPSSTLKAKALKMKDTLVQDQVAANADNTIGTVQEEEASETDQALVGAGE